MRIDEHYIGEDRDRLLCLLRDLSDINKNLNNKIYIDKQYHHDVYSCERTDPCPDYYGLYSLKIENNPRESLEFEPMTIDELDGAICLLYGFCEFCI
ncbi:MAG: hypothetical protein J1F35_08725 [Erysipelotrichales bacterium]|nr:hypothetical protein [Erysipelotrichales bacterium]